MLKKGVEGQKMQEMPLSANEIFRPLKGEWGGGGPLLADGFSVWDF